MSGIAIIWVFVIYGDDNFVFGAAVFFVLFMGYFGIRQVGIFTPHNTPQENFPVKSFTGLPAPANDDMSQTVIPEEERRETSSIQAAGLSTSTIVDIQDPVTTVKKKYSRSGLTKGAAEELHRKLKQIIASEKIFKESELTLTDLSKKLGTHPNYLSQVINEKEGKNFYDYINTLRTEEFIKVITSPNNQKFTLLSLAFECGFNSKSSFNKYFRKVTGVSPSEYLQRLNIKEVA